MCQSYKTQIHALKSKQKGKTMAKSKNPQNELDTQTNPSEQEALKTTQETQETNKNEGESSLESSTQDSSNAESSQKGEQESTKDSSQESTPAQNPQNNTQNPTQNPSDLGVKKFDEILANALENNTSWREQIKITLQTIAETYNAFVALDESYQTGINNTNDALDALNSSTQKVNELATQIATTLAQAKKDFKTMQERAEQAITEANATIESTTQNAKTTNDNLVATEAIFDKVREKAEAILEKEDTILEAYEKWKALDSMLRQANALKAELDTKLEAHRSALNADKEGYETELTQKKDEISRALESLANAKQEALNTLSETKNNTLSEKIDELNTQLETHKAEIQSARDLLAKDHDSLKSEILEALKAHLESKNTEQGTEGTPEQNTEQNPS